MVDLFVNLEGAVLETELADVVGSLRVVGRKRLNDFLLLLLVRELLLVDAAHVGLIHESHFVFVFHVFIVILGDRVLRSLLRGLFGGPTGAASLHCVSF